jgi:uncharacterized protein (UPF0212 family)
MNLVMNMQTPKEFKGWAYCPICTHTVEAQVVVLGRRMLVKPGQKCPRCSSALEAACVVRHEVAAA